jgi:protein O-mannosyl-transferase
LSFPRSQTNPQKQQAIAMTATAKESGSVAVHASVSSQPDGLYNRRMPSVQAVLTNPQRRYEKAACELRRGDLRFALTLFVLTFALFCGSAFNGFVSIDDWRYITSNPHVQAGLTWQTILWSFRSVDASNWHPLAYLSSALDCQLFGLNPAGHHLVSVLIHAASASLLYFILVRMSGARWISWACATAFSVHPLRVESVVWAAERKDVLATFFVLLTVLAYLHHAGRPSAAAYWTWTIAFVLGVLSKPMVMTTPVLLLLLDYWPLQRLDKDFPANFRAAVLRKAPHFLIAIGAGVVAIYASRRGGDLVPLAGV